MRGKRGEGTRGVGRYGLFLGIDAGAAQSTGEVVEIDLDSTATSSSGETIKIKWRGY